jgi:nucleoid-associated protein YgaU
MPDSNAVSQKTSLLRPLFLVLAGALVLGGAAWLALRPAPVQLQASAPAAQVVARPASPAAAIPAAAAAGPSFDIVRVAPGGDAVIAGRAEPNAEISLRGNGRELGRTQADAQGQWVILPDRKLEPGGQELTVTSRGVDGAELRGAAPVIVLVPEAAKPGQATVGGPGTAPPMATVLLTPAAEPPRLLQAPPAVAGKLSLNVVDYDDRGEIRFAGVAPPGSALQVYVDNKPVGDAKTDAQGRWSLQPANTVAPGDHQLRVDQLANSGRVAARIQLPFQRTSFATPELATGRIVVQPRQNLWRMARQAYGQGVRYTVIYAANREQIQDPNRIYPGQVITVPTTSEAVPPQAGAAGSADAPGPSSSSRSK